MLLAAVSFLSFSLCPNVSSVGRRVQVEWGMKEKWVLVTTNYSKRLTTGNSPTLENGMLDPYREIRILLLYLWNDRKRFPIYSRSQHRLKIEVGLPEQAHEILREDFVYSTGTGVHWENLQSLELLVAGGELMQLGCVLMQK